MSGHRRFKIRSLDQFREEVAALGLGIPVSDDVSILGDQVRVGDRVLANRFAANPMEGFDASIDGTPGDLSFRRYRRYATGGVALIWMEATAVVQEGRSNAGQFWLNEGNVGIFAGLVRQTKQAGKERMGYEPVIILQMTHSGRYSKPFGAPEPLIAHHNPILDPIHGLAADHPLIADDTLDELQHDFVRVAELAAEAGFDGVDVKSCHRYLLAELHAAFTREGRYGGSFDNRTRMLRETVKSIHHRLPELLVTTRMNVYDAISYPYGFGVDHDDHRKLDLTEPLRLVACLRELGVRILNVSIGNPYFNPHYNRPYDFAVAGADVPGEHPLVGVDRIIQAVRTVQEANPDLPIIGSGYAWLRQYMPHVAAGVVEGGWATLVGQGRGAFAYPDSVRDILETGAMDPAKCCVTCSACTQIMRDGGKTGCVVRDSDVYGPQYRLARRFAVDRLREEAARCRDCEQATCTRGCPARIDIPAFLRAFADGDIPTAYAVMREQNVLPEMCGDICPACEQCQGHCIEAIFCEHPIPIQDIQLVVARMARLQGLVGARIPPCESGKAAAVVGGGPAGIACAVRLLENGHRVTVFEKSDRLGGVPDTTIPEGRYGNAAAEVDAILKPALDAGRLEIRYRHALGGDVSLEDLRSDYDAVFLGFGLTGSAPLGEAEGVIDALGFLAQTKSKCRQRVPERVAVLGAGNTAMDAGSTAAILGARDVYLVYRRSFKEMPAWESERNEFLEWGGHLLVLTQPLGYVTDGSGKLTGLRAARTRLGEPDSSGRRRPEVIPNTEFTLDVDLVIEAMGQSVATDVRESLSGLGFTDKGLIQVNPGTAATTASGVFAAGDLVNGGTTAVQGIAEGMHAAEEISSYLAD